MRKRFFISIFAYWAIAFSAYGQTLSSSDFAQATGHGPYPITVSVRLLGANGKNVYSDLIQAFNDKNGSHDNYSLWGLEANANIVIADPSLFGIPNFKVNGFTLGMGYRNIVRRVRGETSSELMLREEVFGVRTGYRWNILYPVTFEVSAGPNLFSRGTVRYIPDANSDTIRLITLNSGNGVFTSKRLRASFFSGWDFKLTLKIFDPAGTEGGMGMLLEYGRTFTNVALRQSNRIIEEELGISPARTNVWDYGYFSVGLIFPIAIRTVSK